MCGIIIIHKKDPWYIKGTLNITGLVHKKDPWFFCKKVNPMYATRLYKANNISRLD